MEQKTKLTLSKLEWYLTRFGNRPYCYRCGNNIRVNEDMIIKRGRSKTKHYHPHCFEEMFFDDRKT